MWSARARRTVGLGKLGHFHDFTYNTEASIIAEDLVNNHVVRRNPANPVEIGQTLGNPAREPIPCEAPGKDIEEVSVSTNAPTICNGGIGRFVVVEGIHKSRLGQSLRPDHGSRPDQESADDSGHAEPNTLCSEDKKHLEPPAKILLVEDLLSQEDVSRIGDTSLDRHRRHHHYDGMLLHIEGAGVEVPFQSECVELVVR